jgi:hypothetical protein
MRRLTPSPRADGHDPGMKLTRVLRTLNFILVGAALFAPAPWNWIVGVLAVVVTLVLEWLSS